MTLLSILRPPSDQAGTTLVDDNFDADTIGAMPVNWVSESSTNWWVQPEPAPLTGRELEGTTDVANDYYTRRNFTRQTGGIVTIRTRTLTPATNAGRAGVIAVYDTTGGVVCQVGGIGGQWAYANASGQSGLLGSWAANTFYDLQIHMDLDQKKFKFQVDTTYYDNAGAWWPLTTGTTGIDRLRISVFSSVGGQTIRFLNFQVGQREPAAVPPTGSGTLSTAGTFDGVTLGCDRFAQIVLGYANSDPLIANIKLERSANNSTWEDISATSKVTLTGSGRWTVTDRRPQYGIQSVAYGGTVYYRVSGFNSGGDTPTSTSGAMVSDVNQAAYETSRFAVVSGILAGAALPSQVDGDAYPTYTLCAMTYAYYKTGVAQYLTDTQNQWTYIKTLTHASGIVDFPDFATALFRDFHWRTIMHAAQCSRLLRHVGQTTLANDMISQCETWVQAFYNLASGSPFSSVTRSGWDSDDESGSGEQLIWVASTAYTQGAIVRPVTPNGRTYRVTTAGTTAASQPTWPTTNGGTVGNGSVTFTETTVTANTSYASYGRTAPYNGNAGEDVTDLNQNMEEAAALALLTSDPASTLSSAGALRTSALAHIADATKLATSYATSTGAVPIGDTWPTTNGSSGYDTLYGSYVVELGSYVVKWASALDDPWFEQFIRRGMAWLNASYGTEPVGTVHYNGSTITQVYEFANREFPAKVLAIPNPLAKVRFSAALQVPTTDRIGHYDAVGVVDPLADSVLGKASFLSDVQQAVLDLFQPTGIASAGAMGTPTVATTSTVTGIATAGALGTPTLTQAATVTGIATAGAVGTPTVATTVTVTGITSAGAMGTPSTLTAHTITGIATGEALGTPTVATTATVTGISSGEAMGTPTSTEIAGNVIVVDGIPTAEALGTPSAAVGTAATVTGIATAGALGTPTVATTVTVTGIASAGAMGNPTVVLGQVPQVVAIPSSEVMGTPTSVVVASFALNVAGFFDEGTVLYLYAEPDAGFFLRAAPSLRYRRDEPSVMPLPPPITTVPVTAGAASFPAIEGATTYVVASTSGRVLRFRTP